MTQHEKIEQRIRESVDQGGQRHLPEPGALPPDGLFAQLATTEEERARGRPVGPVRRGPQRRLSDLQTAGRDCFRQGPWNRPSLRSPPTPWFAVLERETS